MLGDWVWCVSRDLRAGLGMSLGNNQRAWFKRNKRGLPEAWTKNQHTAVFTSCRHSQEMGCVVGLLWELHSQKWSRKIQGDMKHWNQWHKLPQSPVHSFRNFPSQAGEFQLLVGQWHHELWSFKVVQHLHPPVRGRNWSQWYVGRDEQTKDGEKSPGMHIASGITCLRASAVFPPTLSFGCSSLLLKSLPPTLLDLLSVKCCPKCSEQ